MFNKIGAGRGVRSLALIAMVTGSMAALAPTAQAEPIQTQFTSPVVGLYLSQNGYAGGESLLVYSTLTAVTDAAEPGVTNITASGPFHCSCTVSWFNETTGAHGTWDVPQVAGFVPMMTGSGKVSATAAIYESGPLRISPTFVTGIGSWVVP